jgi:hypothetical protein
MNGMTTNGLIFKRIVSTRALQELIAPEVVEFFSKDWDSLGSKASLERQICKITGIPVQALRRSRLNDLASLSGSHGQRNAKQNMRKTKCIHYWEYLAYTCR